MVKATKCKQVSKLGGAARRQGQKRKGFVQNRSERGKGLKFDVRAFATVSSFTPGTRIKYGPNPKTLGSKSFTRYAGYASAKTVGEALKKGTKVADLLWELVRGNYKILGTKRSEVQEVAAIGRPAYDKAQHILSSLVGPRGLSMSPKDPRAAEELKREEAWREQKLKRCEALAKQMGLRVETTEEIEAFNECADLRLERRVADALAAQKLKSGKKIRDGDVTEALELWGFCQNVGRLNVLPEGQKYVYSDTLGAIRRRTGGFGITPPTRRYPNFTKLLNQWLADNKPKVACKFVCGAININANYAGRRHRDQNNEGPSVIRAFGKFKGGRLRYWPRDVKRPRPDVKELQAKDCVTFNLAKSTEVFDGNRAHEVESFHGERYSLVFFTAKGYGRVKPALVKYLEKVGFPWPTPKALAQLKRATKTA
mmetsp:Transcript_60869/g.177926  ORF Transcript_60869/g.177926 Transcript_60869/m.177926 type:complete len:426 (-) Transcript_60869:101-1378(-)